MLIFNQIIEKKALRRIFEFFIENYGPSRSQELLEELKFTGFHAATLGGLSIGFDDFRIPPSKQKILKKADDEILVQNSFCIQGQTTIFEYGQQFLDIWTTTGETLKDEVIRNFQKTPLNPLYMMAFSGARGNINQVRQLVGMRGLMSDSAGKVVDFPIRSNFREGLSLPEYLISCYGARKGLIDTALRTADSGYLTRRLVDAAHSVLINEFDCGTFQGIYIRPSLPNLIGRVSCHDIYDASSAQTREAVGFAIAMNIENRQLSVLPEFHGTWLLNSRQSKDKTRVSSLGALIDSSLDLVSDQRKRPSQRKRTKPHNNKISPTRETYGVEEPAFKAKGKIVSRNQDISPSIARKILQVLNSGTFSCPDNPGSNSKQFKIRSALTCQSISVEICQLCYGWNLGQGRLVSVGDAVGILAAQSIGEPGTQLTMRTFHTGGIFAQSIEDKIFAPHGGRIDFFCPKSSRPLGKKFRSLYGSTGWLTFEPLFIRITAPAITKAMTKPTPEPTKDKENQSSSHFYPQLNRVSIIFLPPQSFVICSPGQEVGPNELIASIARLRKVGPVSNQILALPAQAAARPISTLVHKNLMSSEELLELSEQNSGYGEAYTVGSPAQEPERGHEITNKDLGSSLAEPTQAPKPMPELQFKIGIDKVKRPEELTSNKLLGFMESQPQVRKNLSQKNRVGSAQARACAVVGVGSAIDSLSKNGGREDIKTQDPKDFKVIQSRFSGQLYNPGSFAENSSQLWVLDSYLAKGWTKSCSTGDLFFVPTFNSRPHFLSIQSQVQPFDELKGANPLIKKQDSFFSASSTKIFHSGRSENPNPANKHLPFEVLRVSSSMAKPTHEAYAGAEPTQAPKPQHAAKVGNSNLNSVITSGISKSELNSGRAEQISNTKNAKDEFEDVAILLCQDQKLWFENFYFQFEMSSREAYLRKSVNDLNLEMQAYGFAARKRGELTRSLETKKQNQSPSGSKFKLGEAFFVSSRSASTFDLGSQKKKQIQSPTQIIRRGLSTPIFMGQSSAKREEQSKQLRYGKASTLASDPVQATQSYEMAKPTQKIKMVLRQFSGYQLPGPQSSTNSRNEPAFSASLRNISSSEKGLINASAASLPTSDHEVYQPWQSRRPNEPDTEEFNLNKNTANSLAFSNLGTGTDIRGLSDFTNETNFESSEDIIKDENFGFESFSSSLSGAKNQPEFSLARAKPMQTADVRSQQLRLKIWDPPIHTKFVGEKEAIGKLLLPINQSTSLDIVQGLPRIESLFEARSAKSMLEASISAGQSHKPTNLNQGKSKPQNSHETNLLLNLQLNLVSEIQKCYLEQGIEISAQHIEIIVRQMTRKVRICKAFSLPRSSSMTKPKPTNQHFINKVGFPLGPDKYPQIAPELLPTLIGRSNAIFFPDDIVDLSEVQKLSLPEDYYEPIILGITKVATLTKSFISAASFQESKRILMSRSIQNDVDFFFGLKENLVCGRFIPAGTTAPGFGS
jgi:hypothetical protein